MNRPQAAVYAVLVAMFSGGLWLTEHRFDQSVAQLETERHDRCEAGRAETQAAIVAGMEAAGVREETRRVVADAVADALPVDEC